MTASAGFVRAEGGGTGARCDVLVHGPLDCIGIICINSNICKRIAATDRWRFLITVQEGHGLCSSTGCVRAKRGSTGAAGDVLLHSPKHCIIVIAIYGNVGEGTTSGHLGRASGPPQEGHNLSPRARSVRTEGGSTSASGDALLYGPGHSIGVVRAGLNVSKTRCGLLGRYR